MKKTLVILLIFSLLAQSLISIQNIDNGEKNKQGDVRRNKNIDANRIKIHVTNSSQDHVVFLSQGNDGQSLWWNRSWEFRVNVSVSESGVINRTDWPVDVYMSFDPVAHKYSIRVVRVLSADPYFIEIPYQLWNVSLVNSTHVSHATITFMVSIQAGSTEDFQIYWSTREMDPPSYTKRITVSSQSVSDGTKYIVMSSEGWSVEILPSGGGKISNLTLGSGDTVGHSYIHFGVSRNYTLGYEGYSGSGNTNNGSYVWRGFVEEQTSLESIFMGVVFATYEVRNVSLYDRYVGSIGKVNYSYRFYSWGVIVREGMRWDTDDYASYLFGGWVFDQDDGSGPAPTFNIVGRKGNITNLPEVYQYPTMSGTTSATWSKRLDGGETYPWVRVHRINLDSLGTYTIEVAAMDSLFGLRDDPGLIIYSPDGVYVDSTTGNNRVSLSVNTSEFGTGYYFLVIYCSDEDSQNTYMDYDIYVDSNLVDSGTVSASNNYGTIPPDALSVNDLYVDSAYGFEHTVSLSWQTDDDLDLFIFESDGSLAGSSVGVSQGESVVFNATYVGHYSILVHRYSGNSPSVSYTIDIIVEVGPEYIDAYDYGPWNNISFIHSSEPRGIGIDILSEESTTQVASTDTLWYNEGNDSDIDYIFWARRYSSMTIQDGDTLGMSYVLIPWEPAGDGYDRYEGFNRTCIMVENPLSMSIGTYERFLIMVEVNVTDGDGYGIGSANVSFYNSSGSMIYSLKSNSDGVAIVSIERVWWNITVVVNSGGNSYINGTVVTYNDSSRYNYTVHSVREEIPLDIIRFTIKAYNNLSDPSIIQDGYVYLNSSPENNSWGEDLDVEGYTDSLGIFDVYIPEGNWSIRFNKTGSWDRITLYTDYNMTDNITGVGWIHSINIVSRTEYYLRDWDYPESEVTVVSTQLIVTTTPTPLDMYWKEIFNISVELRRSDIDVSINGTILWWILDSQGVLVDHDIGTTNGSVFVLIYNTSNLPAGSTYTIKINATVSEEPPPNVIFQEPVPVEKSLIVKDRPTTANIYFDPATAIYWNESLGIVIEYHDALDSSVITGAYAEANILGVGIFTLMEVLAGIYRVDINNFYWDAGTYTVVVSISKGNYVGREWTYTIVIYERPTDLNAPTYIGIPWQDNYTVYVEYIDSRYGSYIEGALVEYSLLDATNSEIGNGVMVFDGTRYYATINISALSEGTYTIYVHAGKENYENKTADIVLDIRARAADLTPETTKVSIIYGECILVRINYDDIDFNEPIIDASTTYTLMGVDVDFTLTGQLVDLGNGTYLLNISSVDVGYLGTFMIDVYFTKTHYQSRTTTITAVINEIPTTAVASTTIIEVEWATNISITIEYNRTDTDVGVENATNATFRIFHNDTPILCGWLIEVGGGVYLFRINTTWFVNESYPYLGTYQLYIFLFKGFHENQTLVVSLTILEVSTSGSSQPNDLSIIWGYSKNVSILYNRSRDGVFTRNATTIVISSPEAQNAFLVEEVYDSYVLTIYSQYMDVYTTYIVNITLKKQFYAPVSLIIKVTIDPIPTIATASNTVLSVEYGLNVTIVCWYNRTDTSPSVPVDAENKTYIIENSLGQGIIYGTLMAGDDGQYYLIINTTIIVESNTTQSLGTYTIRIIFEKTNHVEQELIITVTINMVDTTCYASTSNITMEWNSTFTTEIYYDRVRDGVFIHNATYNMTIFDENGEIIMVPGGLFVIIATGDAYELRINSSSLQTMLYIVEISFHKKYHESDYVRIFISVIPVDTYAVPSQKSAEAEYPKNFTFKFWYYTETYNITDANTSYSVYYGDIPIEEGNLTINTTDESYELFLYTVDIFEKSGASDLPLTLTIKVTLTRRYHEEQVLYVAYTISAINTKLTVSEKTVTIRFGLNWTFYLNYTDTSGEIVLSDANASYSIYINGTHVKDEQLVFNSSINAYVLFFSSEEIVGITGLLGIYEIRVVFEKKFYEKQTMILSVQVDPMEANLEVSETSVEIMYNETHMFLFDYIDIAVGEQILEAEASYRILYNGSEVLRGEIEYSDTEGHYYLIFDSSVLINETTPNLGIYTIEVTFMKTYYETEKKLLAVNVVPRSTILEASEKSVTIEYGEEYVFMFSFMDAETGDYIMDAETLVEIYYGDAFIMGGELDQEGSEYYYVFSSREIIDGIWPYLGTYTIRVHIGKPLYVPREKIVSITVTEIGTMAYSSPESISIEYGDSAEVLIYYIMENGTRIGDADVIFSVIGDGTIHGGTADYDPVLGAYIIHIDTTILIHEPFQDDWVSFTVSVNMSRHYYAEKQLLVLLTVEKIACSVELSDTEVVAEWGEEANIWIRIIQNSTLAGVSDVNISVDGIPHEAWIINLDGARYVLSINTTLLRITDEENGSYLVTIVFQKDFYLIPQKVITVTVRKIMLDLGFAEDPPEFVEKIQILDEKKTSEISIVLTHRGSPVEYAELFMVFYSVEAGFNETLLSSPTKIPGVFKFMIDWSPYPPGYVWIMEIYVDMAYIYGVNATSERIVYSSLGWKIRMDYLTGSQEVSIPIVNRKIYVANMFYYPLLAIIGILIFYGGYRFITWYRLPVEVKEINRILKRIEKGIFDYSAPDRREFLSSMIKKEVG